MGDAGRIRRQPTRIIFSVGVSDENWTSSADFWSSASVDWEFDWARSIGDRRRGGMVRGKSSDAHDNVDAELKAWPGAIVKLNPTFASIVPIDPCQITVVSRHI